MWIVSKNKLSLPKEELKTKLSRSPTTRNKILFLSITFFISLVLFSKFITLPTTSQQWQEFYLMTINPHAGAAYLEKQWQKNYNGAALELEEGNTYISKMQNNLDLKSSDKYTYIDTIKGILVKRDAYFSEMIVIDKKALHLRLPQQYHDFYTKRLVADQRDYYAFNTYSTGMMQILDGTKAIYQYSDYFSLALSTAASLADAGQYYTKWTKVFNYIVYVLQTDTNDASVLQDKGILDKPIVDAMIKGEQTILLIQKVNNAWVSNDKQGYADANLQMQKMSQQAPPDWNMIIAKWGKDKRERFMIKQDKLHNEATKLYNRAYLFARDEKLNEVINIWGNNFPGSLNNNDYKQL